MTKPVSIERVIADLYEHVAHIPTGLAVNADAEARWRAAAATLQLPPAVRDVLKRYAATDDADQEIRTKALRLVFDTLHTENIDAVVGTAGIEFFVDLRSSVWVSAIKKADGWQYDSDEFAHAELRPLIELLQTEPISEEGRAVLADFIARHKSLKFRQPSRWTLADQRRLAGLLSKHGVKKNKGRPATPIYARSDLDARKEIAMIEYRAYRARFPRSKKEELAKQIAALHRLDQRALLALLDIRDSNSRRKAKRRERAFKGGSKS